MIELNGRHYRRPERPLVVICADGCDPEYLNRGLEDGILPAVAACRDSGFLGTAAAAMPTFTNPNNVSIVTGAPPALHGIAGNYALDRASGREIMLTDPALMRSETILARMAAFGIKTAAVTAKDKLRRLLAHNFEGVAISSECADGAVEALVGRRRPDMYSADLSLFVLDAGIALLRQGAARLLYLSLSDYVQHVHGPGEAAADEFHRALDERLGRLIGLGAVVGLVADHGMNDKPRIVFLEDLLDEQFGAGSARVICPITDPFVRHHGALGSFVRVYAENPAEIGNMMEFVLSLPGIAQVAAAEDAARQFELPLDREADFVVIGDAATAIGSARAAHDLSALAGHRLRSHGGLAEQQVPFLLSHPLLPEYRRIAESGTLRNWDIFDFVLNGIA